MPAVTSRISSARGPSTKPYTVILSTASRVKKAAKDFGSFMKPRFIKFQVTQTTTEKENLGGHYRKRSLVKKSWMNEETPSLDWTSLPTLPMTTPPLPNAVTLMPPVPHIQPSAFKESFPNQITPSTSLTNTPRRSPTSLTPFPATTAKTFRHKRKPVPHLPEDLLDDPDSVIHTSIVETSVIKASNTSADPPTDSTSSTAEVATGEDALANDRSKTPNIITQIEGDQTVSAITRSCLRVVADDATNRFALYWPPEHSYQPLSLTLAKLADGSLNTSQMTNERTVRIAIRKPGRESSSPHRVRDNRRKPYSKKVGLNKHTSGLSPLME